MADLLEPCWAVRLAEPTAVSLVYQSVAKMVVLSVATSEKRRAESWAKTLAASRVVSKAEPWAFPMAVNLAGTKVAELVYSMAVSRVARSADCLVQSSAGKWAPQ